ncbi:MFS transporter [Rhodopirellula sp. JC639]|uniref:MFS transporter n=1 Tax=Stieleria mannarensis TaxID=2755585 RepID=UPI00160357A9|nr:MFS transporter [Rhodopirellula sp. JC639]
MNAQLENGIVQGRRLRGDLSASMIDGAAFGGMVGFGETYIAAFALAVGLGEMSAGMVSSLPLIAGGLMQLTSPTAIRVLKSHKRWVVLCAFLQASTFIPLLIAALLGSIDAVTLLLVVSIYWGTGLATGPAWNTWIGTIVPRPIRARYFAHRTRVSQACVFAGFLIGGVLLQSLTALELGSVAFAILFGVAGVCRLVSTWMLIKQSEPVPLPPGMRAIPWKRVFHHLRASSGGKLLVYLFAVQAAVQMSGPFFTPFMLTKLEFSYGELSGLFSIAFLAKVVSLSFWGRVANKLGAKTLLWIGSLGIVPISVLWVVSQHYAWLAAAQTLSGVFWASYELAFFLLFFESIAEEERTSVLTIYNLLNTAAWVSGSLLGGALLYHYEMSFNGYLILFALSSLGRLFALPLLLRVPHLIVDSDEMGVRTVAVRPGSASLDTPVLASLPDQTGDETVRHEKGQ